MSQEQYEGIKKLKNDRIYALNRIKDMSYAGIGSVEIAMVMKGMVIGSMDLEGNIVEFDVPIRYKKPEVTYKPEPKKEPTPESRSDFSLIDYCDGGRCSTSRLSLEKPNERLNGRAEVLPIFLFVGKNRSKRN